MQRPFAFCLFSMCGDLDCQVSFPKRDAEPLVLFRIARCVWSELKEGLVSISALEPVT